MSEFEAPEIVDEQPPELEPEPEPTPEPEPDDDEEAEAEQAESPLEEDVSQPPQVEPESKADRKRQSTLKGYVDRYVTGVVKTLEEEANDLTGCPLCSGTTTPGFVNVQFAGLVPPDVIDATRLYLGFQREQDYKPDPLVEQCPTCEGKGETSTGSTVATHMKRKCPTCKGVGYTTKPGMEAQEGAAAVVGANGAVEHVEQIGDPDVDVWGDPRVLPDGTLNDNYGKMPQYKHPHPVYGVTANLTAQNATLT